MMNYKETLFFIGKCLTINHEKLNKDIIEKQLIQNEVNWDNVVKVSTAQLVFPALYINLKRADFLHYLPDDLVAYMEHITELNRDRNKELILQAKEINEILIANNITPIFLKGTAFLLQDLYTDIGERMVGDIDILIDKENVYKAFDTLVENGYESLSYGLYEDHRHLQRITHKERIGAIEIHKEMLKQPESDFFNFETIINSVWTKNNAYFLSIEDQIRLSCLAFQVNDDGYFLNSIALKSSYDVFLNFTKIKELFPFHTKFEKYINSYIGVTKCVLSSEIVCYKQNKETNTYIEKTLKKLNLTKKQQRANKLKTVYKSITSRMGIIKKSLFNNSYRKFILSRVFNLEWFKYKYDQWFNKP